MTTLPAFPAMGVSKPKKTMRPAKAQMGRRQKAMKKPGMKGSSGGPRNLADEMSSSGGGCNK